MRSFSFCALILVLFVSVSLAQYQDGGYEGNANSYSRSQYESNDNYAPRNNNYGRAPASYPKSNRPESSAKAKSEEEAAAEEEEKKPSALELLLANSKFSCSSKKDGYYADNSVGCQVFHYCVGGAKHSWMCPEGTVFHQVHLNCVPAAQDICSQSEKYHIVNEYLHKPIEQNYGPNQTVRYHQRYYPEEFLGDPLAPPSTGNIQQYPPPAPSSNRQPSSGYSRPSYNTYEDENSSAYRAAPAYSPPVSRPVAPKPNPALYASYPAAQPKPTPIAKKPTYSSYPASAGLSSAVRQRQPSYDSYDDGSYKPSNTGSYSPSAPSLYPTRSSAPPAYKPSAPAYQPYSAAAAAASPSYKPTVTSSSYRPASQNKPAYSAYQGYQGAGTVGRSTQNTGYDNNNNNKPYDYSGVTYEEDY